LIAADIAVAGINKTDPICEETFDLFFEVLGQVAGDIALALGADQGIFIGGGICQRYPKQLAESKFRKGFENKGRHSHLMTDMPTWLITHKNPGLLGASVFARSFV
jgi:glucokinase